MNVCSWRSTNPFYPGLPPQLLSQLSMTWNGIEIVGFYVGVEHRFEGIQALLRCQLLYCVVRIMIPPNLQQDIYHFHVSAACMKKVEVCNTDVVKTFMSGSDYAVGGLEQICK